MAKIDIPSPEPESSSTDKLSQLYDRYARYVTPESKILLSEFDYFIKNPNQLKIQRAGMEVELKGDELTAAWRCPSDFDDWTNSGDIVNVRYRATEKEYAQHISAHHIHLGVDLADAGMVFQPQLERNKIKFSLYLLYHPRAIVPKYLRDQSTDPLTGLIQFQYFKKSDGSTVWSTAMWSRSEEAYQFWEIGNDAVSAQLTEAFFNQTNNILPGITDRGFDHISYDRHASLIPRVY